MGYHHAQISTNALIRGSSSVNISGEFEVAQIINFSCESIIRNVSSGLLTVEVDIRNAGLANLSAFLEVAQYVILSSEVILRHVASATLGSEVTIRNISSKALSVEIPIRNAGSLNLSIESTIRNAGSLNLSIESIIRNAGSSNLSIESTIRNAGSSNLSIESIIRHTASKIFRTRVIIRHTSTKTLRSSLAVSKIVYPADIGLTHNAYVQKMERMVDMPIAYAVNLSVKDTEYALKLPLGTKKLYVQEKGAASIRLSWEPGHVAAPVDPFIPINSLPYREDDLHLLPRTIYLASPADNKVAEILVWI